MLGKKSDRITAYDRSWLDCGNEKSYGRIHFTKPDGSLVNNGGKVKVAVFLLSLMSLIVAFTSLFITTMLWRKVDVYTVESLEACAFLSCSEFFESPRRVSDQNRLESLERLFHVRERLGNDQEEKIKDNEEYMRMCCAEDASEMLKLLTKILVETGSKKSEEQANERALCSEVFKLKSSTLSADTSCIVPSSMLMKRTPVAAHLVPDLVDAVAASIHDRGSSYRIERLKWNYHSRRSFCRGLNCTSEHLVPRVPGVYYIYSQVSFNFRSFSDDEVFTHAIKRFNERYPNGGVDSVFEHISTIPPHSRTNESGTDSSFLGGLVKIWPNDMVFVEVSHLTFIQRQNGASFFGMYRV